jgi:hypothetical protein
MLIDSPAPPNLDHFPSVRSADAEKPSADNPPAIGQPRWLLLDASLIGIVVLLGVAAGFTAVGGTRHRHAIDQLANEFTQGAETYRLYLKTHAAPPPNSDAAEPDGATSALVQGEGWTSPSTVGGIFRWVNDATSAPAGNGRGAGWIMLAGFPPAPEVDLSHADLLALDRRLDDGNLATGRFRTGFNGWPVYLVTNTP